jgi:hypothetical protein
MTDLFPMPPPAAPESEKPQTGEFTRLFKAPPSPISQTPRISGSGPPPSSAKENSATGLSPAEPGHFSKELPNAAAALDHEHSRLFEPLAAQPASPARQESSDFAKFFESPLGPSAPDLDFDKHEPPLAPPAPQRAGEFTRMFGAPFLRDQARQPMVSRDNTANATGLFSKPSPEAQWTNSKQQGPGDYTRTFDARSYLPRGESAQAPPATPAPPVSPQPAFSLAVVVGVLATLLVVAVALVLYFALRI